VLLTIFTLKRERLFFSMVETNAALRSVGGGLCVGACWTCGAGLLPLRRPRTVKGLMPNIHPAINATATFLLCREIGRGMIARGRGKIINVGSTDGIIGVPDQVAYCASKGAVVQLTKTLGAEWIKHGVNVNAIGPCDFDTPMIAGALDDPEYADWIVQAIPAGRIGQARELAGAAIYLASDASDMVAGHMLMVDGGRTII